MTYRKTFQIKDLNNENIKSCVQVLRGQGIKVQQSDIMNLAIELFFRDTEHQDLLKILKTEHII